MKPRIFVSSTFYDLKYIREDLSNFIKAHDFEPIMFEDGDIGYTPGLPLDESCYETMHSTDIVILIIGGNYGSPATGETKDEFKEYMSITRNEFKAALEQGVPVYVFVDSKVYVEYGVYEANYKKIEEEKNTITFRNVKNINVFRFIREIKSVGNISITEFDKIIHIKDFLSKQWSDMFKNYLDSLKQKKSDKKLESTVDEMKILIKNMGIMIDSVGQKILNANESEEYRNVLMKQEIYSFCDSLVKGIELEEEERCSQENERITYIRDLLDALYESIGTDIWDIYRREDVEEYIKFYEYFEEFGINLTYCMMDLDKTLAENRRFYDNMVFREILISQLAENENYNTFFEEVS
ncbi:MAG: DUF4062 domain-containing protein [Dorea sp.]|jgi:hypothetical protein|nr:DUF4062 domain-containing protein [Dorea sp.]